MLMIRLTVTVLVASLLALVGVVPGRSQAAAVGAGSAGVTLANGTDSTFEYVIEVPTESLEVGSTRVGGTEYVQVSLPAWQRTQEAGAPDLPYHLSTVGAPFEGQVRIEVEPGDATRLSLPAKIKPVATLRAEWGPGSLASDPGKVPAPVRLLVEDGAVYGSAAGYPGVLAEVVSDVVVRQQRLVGIAAYPIQYKPATGELVVYHSLLVRLVFKEGEGPVNAAWAESDAYSALLSNTLLNPESAQAWARPPAESLGPEAGPWAPPVPGYRVYVEEEGIYQLTYGDLEDAQIPLPMDPSSLRMYAGGQEIAIHVEGEEDGVFDTDDFVLFYGQALTSKYSAQNAYWLTYGGDPGLRMASRDGTPGTGTLSPARTARLHMEDNVSYRSYLPGDENVERYTWSYLYPPGAPSWTHSFSLPALAAGDWTARLEVQMFGGNIEDNAVDPHRTQIFVNGHLVEDATWNGVVPRLSSIGFPQSYLNVGDNAITLTSPNVEDVVFIDWLALEYEDLFEAENDALGFGNEQPGAWAYAIDGFSREDIFVFDVTNSAAAQRIAAGSLSGSSAPFRLSFSDDIAGATEYWVVAGPGFLRPQSIQADTSSDLQSITNSADYILVTHAAFSDAMQPLLARRTDLGLRVVEVDVQDAYDEFGYGLASPQAIRDFLEYAYENWERPAPTYVVLVGDGHRDPKNHEGYGMPSFIPPYLAPVDPWIGETAADNLYVSFTEGDSLPEMILGRLPVNSAAEATAVVAKTLGYEQLLASGGGRQSVLLVADDTDGAGNFAQISEDLILCCVPPSHSTDRVYYGTTHSMATDARTGIISGIDTGQAFVNYVGHAGVTGWAEELLFSVGDVSTLANDGKFPIMLPMTCYDGYYHYPYPWGSSQGESIVRAANKGAVASWSPTGLGVATGHDQMNRGFFDAVFQDKVRTLGQATLAGLQRLAASGANLDLLNTYILFGDPALQIQGAPTAVTLGLFAARVEADRSVALRWETSPRTGVQGFDLYRLSGATEQRVNTKPIASLGPAAAGGFAFEFRDGPLAPGDYTYWLESTDSTAARYGPVHVVVWESRQYLPLIRH